MNHRKMFWIAFYVACATILAYGLLDLREVLS